MPPLRHLRTFYVKAYEENITGLSAMVAYNLMLAIFPFTLLLLFVAGQVLSSPHIERSVLTDLQRIFPSATEQTLRSGLDRVRESSTSIGVLALLAGVWIGTSFWGAMDTAFCRIYHVPCRSWLAQKRFGLAMLLVAALFIAATLTLPAAEALLISGTHDLPFGLSDLPGLVTAGSIVLSLVVLFAMLCVVYQAVPKALVPWSATWPGALLGTVGIGAINWAFPFYLDNISTLAKLGTSVGFVLIALVWFYIVALIVLSGAVVNAMRFEKHDTGEIAAESHTISLT
jgi:YihY family inner membrane protein